MNDHSVSDRIVFVCEDRGFALVFRCKVADEMECGTHGMNEHLSCTGNSSSVWYTFSRWILRTLQEMSMSIIPTLQRGKLRLRRVNDLSKVI